MKRGFHTLLGKPVDMYVSHMLVYSGIESVSYLAIDGNVPWSAALVLAAAGFRVLLEPVGMVMRKVTWKLPEFLSTPLSDLHRNVFLNDLKIDVQRHRLTESQHHHLISQVTPSVLTTQAIYSYLGLSFFRAIHALCDSPEYYPGLAESSFLWIPQITAFDPFFIAPGLVGVLNYYALRRARHPLLLPYSERHKALLAFMSSLGAVLLPGAYLLSWSALVGTHMALETGKARWKGRID